MNSVKSQGNLCTILKKIKYGQESFPTKKRRLIVSYKNARAKRAASQQQIIEKTKKKTLGTEGNTQKLITNQGVKKFTKTEKSTTVLGIQNIM